MSDAIATPTEDAILVDDYSRSGWEYQLLYYPVSGDLRVIVEGSEQGKKVRYVFAPPAEKADEVFRNPFQNFKYEIEKTIEKVAS
jgi:hypothetical protein